jgi:hypothetical protein
LYFEDKVKMCLELLEAGGDTVNTSTIAKNHKSYKGHLIELLDNNKIYEVGQT